MKRRGTAVIGAALLGVLIFLMLRRPAVPVEAFVVGRGAVRQFVAEEGKTILAEEYVIDMPVSGTLERVELQEGDHVAQGQVLARIDSYPLEQEIRGIKALIEQARAQIDGVDVEKPKPEQLRSAAIRVKEMADNEAIARKEQTIAENDFQEAQRQFERAKQLLTEGAVSQQHHDSVERAYLNAQEALERAKLATDVAHRALEIAQLNQTILENSIDDNEFRRVALLAEIDRLVALRDTLATDLEKTTIRSPIDGVVLEKHVKDRLVLPAGTALLTLGDTTTIEIECDILAEEVVGISLGDPVEISGKALGDGTIMGAVKRIYPSGFKKISSLGIEQQRVRIRVDFDNSLSNLRPGTSVDIKVITDTHEDTLVVPERAIFRREGGWAVFKLQKNRVRIQPVEIGLKNDARAEVTSGLEAGDRIAAEPKNDLEDGIRVVVERTITWAS